MITIKQYSLRGLTALYLLAPLTSFASPATFEDGFYIGAKIGAQEVMADSDSTHNMLLFQNGFPENAVAIQVPPQNAQDYHTNFMGNLNIGYARVLEQFFLAAEFSVNLATEQELNWQVASTEFSSGLYAYNLDHEVKLENPDIIFDLRPGLLLASNTLLYSRIGIALNKLSIEQEGSAELLYAGSGINIPISSSYAGPGINVPISSSKEENVFAMRIGFGLEYKFTQNLAMNVDYVFTDYGSIETDFTSTETIHVTGATLITDPNISTKADVTKNTMTAGFNWYFGGKKT